MGKSTFKSLISKNSIKIPVIQRDYVQGRGNTAEELDKRESFADKLVGTISKSLPPCNLEFIYGANDGETGTFVPLDGQQRLTTLFLLHWVIWYKSSDEAKRGFRIEDLKNFSYETRLSSSAFCKDLIEKGIYLTEDGSNLKGMIENQPWFSEDWRHDPTISAMLEMIDCFDRRFRQFSQNDIDFMLKNTDAVTFDEISMSDYGLTDELYIRMNARGKQLTKYENWKSDFIKYLNGDNGGGIFSGRDLTRKTLSGNYKDYFCYSIEHEWTDLFWTYMKADAEKYLSNNVDSKNNSSYPVIDELFMNFLDCLCLYRYYVCASGKSRFEDISLQEKRFIWQDTDFMEFLMKSLDSLYRIKDHEQFFENLFYISDEDMPGSYADGKVRLFRTENRNLFRICIEKGSAMELTDLLLFISLLKYCNAFKVCEVDDNLKAYMRQVRNYFESELQNTKTQTLVQLNLRADRFASYDSKIEEFVSRGNFDMPTEEMCRIEDCRFIRGNVSVFDVAISQYGEKTTEAALDTFCRCDDLKRVRLLISCGYRGAFLGHCIGRNRYFFGKNQRWDVLFISDVRNLDKVFSSLTGKCKEGKDGDQIILEAGQTVPNGSFAYYMLKYDSFANANKSMYHYAANGDIDDVDLIALGSYKSNPGMAYHTDPLAVTVMEIIKKDCSDVKLSIYGLYSNKCPLMIIKDDKEYFSLLSVKKGWRIASGQNLVTDNLKERFHVETDYDGNLLIPKSKMEKDMIETGVDIIKAVLS